MRVFISSLIDGFESNSQASPQLTRSTAKRANLVCATSCDGSQA
jgi:hypothetical protein